MNEPTNPKAIKHLGKSIVGMQTLPEIPWPDKNCIICTEDQISSMLDSDFNQFVMILHEDSMNKRFRSIPSVDDMSCVEFMEIYSVFTDPKHAHSIRVRSDLVSMMRVPNSQFQKSKIDRDEQKENIEKQIRKMATKMYGANMTDETAARLRLYYNSYCYDLPDEIWIARSVGGGPTSIGLATDVLGYLSNIVMPCHYFVRTEIPEGFGNRRMRRLTRDKPIISVIGYDRLHKVFLEGLVDHQGGTVEPHFRRGHVKHRWKDAGLNRLALPEDMYARMALVHRHRVQRVYCPPTWIGQKTFHQDGAVHEIMTDDIPLNLI